MCPGRECADIANLEKKIAHPEAWFFSRCSSDTFPHWVEAYDAAQLEKTPFMTNIKQPPNRRNSSEFYLCFPAQADLYACARMSRKGFKVTTQVDSLSGFLLITSCVCHRFPKNIT